MWPIATLAVLVCLVANADGVATVPPSRGARCVAVLPLRGEMDAISMEGLCERARQARAAGADAVVIALDTPGGEVTSTLELCRRIKSDFPANTVAWIRPRAFSAGTLAALACREIVVTPDAVFGDAAPIAVSPWTGLQALPPTERAKLEAPLLSEVTDSARRRGHDERLCRAFVSAPEELWLLEDPTRGERFIVDAAEYEGVFGGPAPTDAPRTTSRGTRPVPWITDALRRPGSAESDPLQQLPRGRAPLQASDAARLRLVSRIDGADELLTLRAAEAVALGMATAEIADETALRAHFGATSGFTIEPRWSEGVARFLTNGWIRAGLVIALAACFVGEMLAPGLGACSIGGIAAAALLVGGPLLAGLADWWPAVALLAGLGLVAAELLVLPGSILAGAIGAVAFAAGTIGLFVVSDPSPDPTGGVVQGLLTLAGAVLAAFGMAWWIGRGDGGVLGKAVLRAELADGLPDPRHELLGVEGEAITDLRPVGRVRVGEAVMEARAAGWIPRGTRVRVIEAQSRQLVVEIAP